jgi:HAE1 family hydrophobic/amphiphilic exporter-1
VLVYVVMCAMFESLIYPAAILTTFIFSIFGVFWLFWITGTTFSIMAMIGVLILMGVVVNNGIVMIVHINQLRQPGCIDAKRLSRAQRSTAPDPDDDGHGDSRHGAAVRLECIDWRRRSPVLSDGARDRGRIGFSTLVSLLVLPTIYSLLDDMSLTVKRLLREARGRKIAAPAAG